MYVLCRIDVHISGLVSRLGLSINHRFKHGFDHRFNRFADQQNLDQDKHELDGWLGGCYS